MSEVQWMSLTERESHVCDLGLSSATYASISNCEFRRFTQTSDFPETQMITIMIYCANLKLKSFNKYCFENSEM